MERDSTQEQYEEMTADAGSETGTAAGGSHHHQYAGN